MHPDTYFTIIHSFTGITYSGSRTCRGSYAVHLWEGRWDHRNVKGTTFFPLMWVLGSMNYSETFLVLGR